MAARLGTEYPRPVRVFPEVEVSLEVRRVRREMSLWGFPPREIEDEVERVRALGLGPVLRRADR